MKILKTLLLGNEGHGRFLGTLVKVTKTPPEDVVKAHEAADPVTKVALTCLSNDTFRVVSQGQMHVLAHEMGHAKAHKLLTGKEPILIKVFLKPCTGETSPHQDLHLLSDWKKTIVDVAGPLANMAFSGCKLVAAAALKDYISTPVALVIAGGATIWMTAELGYALVSAVNQDDGDFGSIAKRGKLHLAAATAALVSQCALGVFAATRFLRQ